jgi:hypothetical protein
MRLAGATVYTCLRGMGDNMNPLVSQLLLGRENRYVEMIDLGQRSLDDYAPDGLGLLTVVGMKSPRYGKGYKYCSSCREAFLTISKLCPRCGMRLRSKPRRENFRNM